jgi:hypothetical protein
MPSVGASTSPGKRQGQIAAYRDKVAGLADSGLLTAGQASELSGFAAAL